MATLMPILCYVIGLLFYFVFCYCFLYFVYWICSLCCRSILRAQTFALNENNGNGTDFDIHSIVINYHEMCNDIYICDWK